MGEQQRVEWGELNSFWLAKEQQRTEWSSLENFWSTKEQHRLHDVKEHEWKELNLFWQQKEDLKEDLKEEQADCQKEQLRTETSKVQIFSVDCTRRSSLS